VIGPEAGGAVFRGAGSRATDAGDLDDGAANDVSAGGRRRALL